MNNQEGDVRNRTIIHLVGLASEVLLVCEMESAVHDRRAG